MLERRPRATEPSRGVGEVVPDISERREAGSDRMPWRELLAGISSISSDAILAIDEHQRIVIYNEAAERVFGWSREEVLGKPLDVLRPERFREPPTEDRARCLPPELQGTTRSGERRTVTGLRKNGEEFPADVAVVTTDVGGKRFLSLVLRDVTERERAERALRESEERLRVALDDSPAVIFTQDRDLRFTWIRNPRAPFTAEEVIGRTDEELLPPEDAGPISAIKRRVLESGVGTREVVKTTIDGEACYYDVKLEPVRDENGSITGLTGTSWDVTDGKRTEHERGFLAEVGKVLVATSTDYDASLAAIADLAVRDFADCCIVDVVESGSLRRLHVANGDPDKDEACRVLRELFLDRQLPHLFRPTLETGKPTLLSDVPRTWIESIAQGEEHRAALETLEIRSLVVVPLVVQGRLLGAIAFIASRASRYGPRELEVAQEVALQAALALDAARLHDVARRAIAARDQVFGIVAHDLRDPLNSISMAAQLLTRIDGGPERRDQGPLDVIQRATDRMGRLIGDMLDVAKLEAGGLTIRHEPLEVAPLLAEARRARRGAASAAGLDLAAEVSDGLPAISADRDRLLQVLDNLIGNAIKFTPAGGRITLGAAPGDGEVRFRVADTGPGIPAEDVPRLFDRFWRARKTDRRGAGLGLPIVKGIVEAHGGRLWVESRVGRGTTFYFTLPIGGPPEDAPRQSWLP